MIPTLQTGTPACAQWLAAWGNAPQGEDAHIRQTVATIIAQVEQRGFDAVADYTEKYDGWRPHQLDDLCLTPATINEKAAQVAPELAEALAHAAARIRAFHERDKPAGWQHCDDMGVTTGRRLRPVHAAGVYAPGGTALYPSSVLMNLVPAAVAGVPRRVLASPLQPERLTPVVAKAAQLGGCTDFWCIGGAQAIAALACGLGAHHLPVDLVVGPGNKWVAEAKRQLYGRVGIDSLAGPSEIVIVADATADADWVALDMCAQAEHDPSARAVLLTWDAPLLARVAKALRQRVPQLARRHIVTASLREHGALVLCDHVAEAIAMSNQLAPEHVHLCMADASAHVDAIVAAGALFIGQDTAEVLGDYIAGSNHVLPTARQARYTGGLSTATFMTSISTVAAGGGMPGATSAQKSLWRQAAVLARAEGLEAHALAAEARAGNG